MAHRSTGRHVLAWLTVAALSVSPLFGQSKTAPKPADLDKLLAPIALYPDQLLAQILLCAGTPGDVVALNGWLSTTTSLKGSELQDAAQKAGFQPSFVALALFPQTIKMMADQLDWTKQLGQAFTSHRADVFASIQRLRAQAKQAGNLKTTAQQEVETRTTSTGQEVIVIEPANPQIVYVPQYNSQVIYTTPAPTTVVVDNSSSSDAAVAAVVGFGVGIAIGAAIDNDYYYGPYGWRGGAYMYNDAWDDYYDHREDAREDWMDHREDMSEERGDRAENAREQRTERTGNREATGANAEAAAQNRTSTQSRTASQESRGYSGTRSGSAAAERSGTSSGAFSGYSSGKSERAASSRGQSSRGARSGGGGGGRRR